MSRRAVTPVTSAIRPTHYRILQTLENEHDGGFYPVGTIIPADRIRQESLLTLLDRGVLMFHLDSDQMTALNALD